MEETEEDDLDDVPCSRPERDTEKGVEKIERIGCKRKRGRIVRDREDRGHTFGRKGETEGDEGVEEGQLREEEKVEASGWAKEEEEEEKLFEVVKKDPWTGERVMFKLPREAAEREWRSRKAQKPPLLGRNRR